MKKIWKLSLLILIMNSLQTVKAQFNLIPNSSFEIFDTCPNNGGQLQGYARYWINPTHESPDYLNACTSNLGWSVPNNGYGFEPAHSGDAYAAIVTAVYNPSFPLGNNYREYLEAELTDTLVTGIDYCVRFYVSACDSMQYVSNNIGIYFSQSQIYNSCIYCTLPYLPQIENPQTNSLSSRNGWTEISGNYTALGGEKYIVIGNFNDTSTTIATATGWSSNNGFYFTLYYVDDILVTPCDSLTGLGENILTQFNIYPNPSSGSYLVKEENESIRKISIYNSIGKLILQKENAENKGEISINITDQSNGMYLISIVTDRNKYNIKLIKN